MRYKVAGVDSIIIYFGDVIDEKISKKVLDCYNILKTKPIEGIIEIIPSYTTLYVQFNLDIYKHKNLFEKLKQLFNQKVVLNNKTTKVIEIPVYYDEEVGVDLQRVAMLNKLSIAEVIKLHSSKIYRVYTIGFSPGFAYMGEINKKIKTPRLDTPRQKVPKGSVAIADIQTAIYPSDSPGGWNILGRTYIDMFDKNIDGFSYLKVGDSVKFVAITKDEFLQNGGKI